MTPWTVAHHAPLSMEFSRQEYWSGLPFFSPGDLPDPGIEPGSPALQADFLLSKPPANSVVKLLTNTSFFTGPIISLGQIYKLEEFFRPRFSQLQIIGKNTSVYPLNALRGVFPSGCIVKSQNDIVKRK